MVESAGKPMFFVLNTKQAWSYGVFAGLKATDKGLSFAESVGYIKTDTIDLKKIRPDLNIAAIAQDSCGVLYLLDKTSRTLYALGEDRQQLSVVSCLQEWLCEPVALVYSGTSFYVADHSSPKARLLKVSLTTGQVVWMISANSDSAGRELRLKDPFTPKSVSVSEENIISASDRNHQVVLQFDDGGRWVQTTKYESLIQNGGKVFFQLAAELQIISVYVCTDIFQESNNEQIQFINNQSQLYGTYTSTALDSGTKDAGWYKLLLNTDIPAGTQIKLSYAVSNTKKNTGSTKDKDPTESIDWITVLIKCGVTDLLIRGKGRYLHLKIEMFGTTQLAPILKSIQVVMTHESYTDYLPEIYREEENSREFLDRFLSLFQTFLSETEQRIERMPLYFDIDGASDDFLRWLAAWLACTSYQDWPERKLRLLLNSLPYLYRNRGTRAAIGKMIELITECPAWGLIESFRYQTLQDKELRQIYQDLYGIGPYHFTVVLNPECRINPQKLALLRSMLDHESPAHVITKLVSLEPFTILDGHTYLDVNSYLCVPESARLDQGARLSRNTVLTDLEKSSQMGHHARLELDAVLA